MWSRIALGALSGTTLMGLVYWSNDLSDSYITYTNVAGGFTAKIPPRGVDHLRRITCIGDPEKYKWAVEYTVRHPYASVWTRAIFQLPYLEFERIGPDGESWIHRY